MLTQNQTEYVNRAYKETIEDIEGSRSLLRPEFKRHSTMYVFTTENIGGYLKKIDVTGKNVLTVAASGDHLLNLVLHGATNIDNFDLNENTYFMMNLKIAALKALSYQEFITYFTDSDSKTLGYVGMIQREVKVNPNPSYFDYQLYLKIRPYLEEDVAMYWDMLYQKFNNDSKELTNTYLFYGCDKKAATQVNDYLKDEESYLRTRERIDSVNFRFFPLDVRSIHEIPGEYDYILLSNIYDYVSDQWDNDSEREQKKEDYIRYTLESLNPILKPKGKVMVSYQYHYRMKNHAYKPSLKNLFKSKWVFDKDASLEKFKMKKIMVPSVVSEYQENGGMDMAYIAEPGKSR